MKKSMLILAATALIVGGPLVSRASESSPAARENDNSSKNARGPSLVDQGMAASHAKDFQKALKLFEQALKENPKDPDILNMLAHSQREIGKIDEAIANYKKALELRPNFPEAREYLGEAYLEAALDQVRELKKSGDSAKEEIEELTNDFKEAARKL